MRFCNINFNIKNKKELFEYYGTTKLIFTPNAAIIVEANKSKRLLKLLNSNYACFDGQIPYLTAKIFCKEFNKNGYFEKLSGSDIIYDFCDFAEEKNYTLFILGGEKKYNEIAVNKLKNKYKINIGGYSPDYETYPFSKRFNDSCLNEIEKLKPEILFVGFGTPKENYWADDNYDMLSILGVKYIICSGGTVDFIANRVRRAPLFIQKIGLEGIFRFYQQPNKVRLNRLFISFMFFKYINHLPDFKFF
jgi:N-acetylglucosaminyldiphosphoundecaprenol N-acetyl-beta-D-mannosaminyltransferase